MKLLKGKSLRKRTVTTASSLRYPYKRLISCPQCSGWFFGSASRGRAGRYYPAYHCDKRGHYYRVPLERFHETVQQYLKKVRIKKKFITSMYKVFSQNEMQQKQNSYTHEEIIKGRIFQLNNHSRLLIDKMKILHSEVALRALEAELEQSSKEKEDLEKKLKELQNQIRNKQRGINNSHTNKLPQKLIVDHAMLSRKQLFALLFVQLPTYEEICNSTAILNKEFELKTV